YHRDHPTLPSFPTRRSSDLRDHPASSVGRHQHHPLGSAKKLRPAVTVARHEIAIGIARRQGNHWPAHAFQHGNALLVELLQFLRSEEHTSELQSRENLVCRL